MPKVIITQQVFNAVKTLLAGGATRAEAAEYMNISKATVNRIDNAETLEEYKAITYASMAPTYYAKKGAKKEEPPQEQKPNLLAGNYTLNRLYELMKEQNELLKGISNKIAFVVDELTK